jgi:predicted kinase
MEAVIFVGLQGAGKTTFYAQRFIHTHLRISLDVLRTRHRERLFLQQCLASQQPFVVDNTNPTAAERARYAGPAREAGFRVAGYVFAPDVPGSLRRNAARADARRVPPVAIYSTHKKLQPPSLAEGFDALYQVTIDAAGAFVVAPWQEWVTPAG